MKRVMIGMVAAGLAWPMVETGAQNPEPEGDRSRLQERGRRPVEKAAFLGVAVSPAPESLRAQLGVAPGTGLLVHHVEPESAALGKVLEHDLLVRFNDQILVNQDQLTVLVRNAGAGAEARLTLLRMGREEELKLTLGEREMPVGRMEDGFGFPPFRMAPQGGWNPEEAANWARKAEEMMREFREWRERTGPGRERGEDPGREGRERFEGRGGPREPQQPEPGRGEMGRGEPGGGGPGAAPERGQPGVGGPGGPGTGEPGAGGLGMPGRGEPGRSPVVRQSTWVEDGLILNLVQTGESRRLTVEKDGEKVFEGPVDTEEQREKLPEEYRSKLEKMGGVPPGPEKAQGANIL